MRDAIFKLGLIRWLTGCWKMPEVSLRHLEIKERDAGSGKVLRQAQDERRGQAQNERRAEVQDASKDRDAGSNPDIYLGPDAGVHAEGTQLNVIEEADAGYSDTDVSADIPIVEEDAYIPPAKERDASIQEELPDDAGIEADAEEPDFVELDTGVSPTDVFVEPEAGAENVPDAEGAAALEPDPIPEPDPSPEPEPVCIAQETEIWIPSADAARPVPYIYEVAGAQTFQCDGEELAAGLDPDARYLMEMQAEVSRNNLFSPVLIGGCQAVSGDFATDCPPIRIGVLDPSAVHYWSFDTIENGMARDVTGSPRTGHLTGNSAPADGVLGRAVEMDGANGYITTRQASLLNIGDSWTVSFWINRTIPDSDVLFVIGNTEAPDDYKSFIHVDVNNDGNVGLTVYGDEGDMLQGHAERALPSFGQWQHFALTKERGGRNFSLFIDGIPFEIIWHGDGEITTQADRPRHIRVGEGLENSRILLNAKIDEFAVYNRPLTPDEILGLSLQEN